MRRRSPALVLSVSLCASAAAAQVPVEVRARGDARLVVDGVLRDWSGELRAVDERGHVTSGVAAWQGPDDASFAFALAHDATNLWVAAEVRDDRVVRTRQHRPADDTLVLTFAAGAQVTEVELQPGEPGAFAAAARYGAARSGPIAGVTVVEAPLASGGGFTLEARIPWAALPGVREALSSLRARVAYRDADLAARPAVDSVIATGPGDAQHPDALALVVGAVGPVAPGDLLERFRREHNCVGVEPLLNRPVDVGGDARTERVVVFPGYVVVFGPGVLDGASYSYLELPSRDAASLRDPRVLDVTGDRHEEVILTWRSAGEGELQRDVQLVYQVDEHGALRRIFAQELSRRRGDMAVTDRVTFSGASVEVSADDARGFTAATLPAVREAGIEEMLLPWGPVRARVWQWNAAQHAFTVARETANPQAQANVAPSVAPSVAPAARAFDPEPLLRLVRSRAQLDPSTAPDHSATGNVAEDPTPEQVVVFGRTMAVIGPRFLGGATFYSMALPLNDGDRVLSLRLADVTGDGASEAVLRVQRQVTTQVQGAPVVSRREMVLVYGIDAPVRRRLFAAEVARRVGDAAIENELTIPASGGGLRVRAGAARGGWSATTYPFHDSAPQGYFPLLLPWDPTRAEVTYRWNGTAFERAP